MKFPLASDYQDAIQNPQTCFQDPGLRAGTAAVTRLGLPRVASGNFASVYEIRSNSHRWAIRCFLRQGSDQQDRYARLSQLLSTLKVPGLVGFAYLPQGIRVRGQWYPIVRMEWVEGETLHTYVEKHLNDSAVLRNLALQWLGLIDRLRQHQIAHADLQHGNILVTPQGQLRLVDYDGMFVPSLRGQSSYELGHPNYQHPRRTAADYDERLDNFSALVIYVSLIALIAHPGLWEQFHSGENLIFAATDFKNPSQSLVLQYLLRSSEPAVRALSQRLVQACEGPLANVPDFKSVVATLPTLPERKPWWQSAEATPTPKPPAATPNAASAAPPASGNTSAGTAPAPASGPPVAPWWDEPKPVAPRVELAAQQKSAVPAKAEEENQGIRRSFFSGCLGVVFRTLFVLFFMLAGLVCGSSYLSHQVQQVSREMQASLAPEILSWFPVKAPTKSVSSGNRALYAKRQKARTMLKQADALLRQHKPIAARRLWQQIRKLVPHTPEYTQALHRLRNRYR